MFLNLVQLSESFGVSEKVINGWIRHEGLPHTPDRGRMIFDREQVAQWAETRGLATKAGFLAPDATRSGAGVLLEPLFRAGGIWRNIHSAELSQVIDKVITALPGISAPVGKMLSQRICAKGGLTIAPVGGGFALPHPATRLSLGRASGTVALVRLCEPLVFTEPQVDEEPVTILLFFIAPSARGHLELLGRLSRSLACAPLRQLVVAGEDDEQIYRAFYEFDTTGKCSEAQG